MTIHPSDFRRCNKKIGWLRCEIDPKGGVRARKSYYLTAGERKYSLFCVGGLRNCGMKSGIKPGLYALNMKIFYKPIRSARLYPKKEENVDPGN